VSDIDLLVECGACGADPHRRCAEEDGLGSWYDVPSHQERVTDALAADRDRLQSEVERLTKERDDSRDAARMMSDAYDRAVAHGHELRAEADRLRTRISELLATIVRVTNETPFSDEAKDALEQRGKLVAEVGTLKAERDELHRELKAVVDYAIDVVGLPARAMLGPDAPVRVMRHLHAQFNHAVSENMAFNVKVAGEINEARQERDSMRRVVELARRVVSRGIHRRQDHREVMLREVTLLPNDIEILGKLADAISLTTKDPAR
jgi:uncharacterized coiled-coil DUF342 family protein